MSMAFGENPRRELDDFDLRLLALFAEADARLAAAAEEFGRCEAEMKARQARVGQVENALRCLGIDPALAWKALVSNADGEIRA